MQLDKDKKYLGAVPRENFLWNKNKAVVTNNNNDNVSTEIGEKLRTQISSGYKVMVIMRGAPGSGKTTLANKLLQRTVPVGNIYRPEHFIFSTDDYFFDSFGRYRYNPYDLDKAHANNQRRVNEKAKAGWSPIIIDNTNMQLWEMMAYVEVGVRFGYLIEILEPKTPWRHSASKLALRNQHNVPADKIQLMLSKYENGAVADLLKMLKYTRYTMPLPQMRKHPPIMITSPDVETDEKFQINQQRNVSTQQKIDQFATLDGQANITSTQITPSIATIAEFNSNAWKTLNRSELDIIDATDMESSTDSSKPTLLDLLREGISEVQTEENLNIKNSPPKSENQLQRHKINCRNENSTFAALRQIYPNRRISELWDLFEKCNGNADWAVDILLKENELSTAAEASSYTEITNIDDDDDFVCNCDFIRLDEPVVLKCTEPTTATTTAYNFNAKPQRSRHRKNQTQLDINFSFNDMRGANKIQNAHNNNSKEVSVQTDVCDEDQEQDNKDFIEVTLGKQFVQQLTDSFHYEIQSSLIPENLNTNIFIPRALARELYMLWIESSYNQMEEQRHKTLRDDEDFARLLKIPKYEHFKQSPSNVQELLDFELALKLVDEKEPEAENAIEAIDMQPNNLAEHLTQMKLCEDFPHIPRDTLLDILASNGNSFIDTVEMLRSSDPEDSLKQQMDNLQIEQSSSTSIKSQSVEQQPRGSLQPEEAKRLALLEFEEMRNMAAHHCQLKAECYQKGKEAIQKGNSTVALYYSQVANCHKEKIDMYNHRAANSIVEVHKQTQDNPDLLDLHYLHVIEAIICLDLFLDGHITALRNSSRVYKHIFIITGRGLHSVGGVSSIKNKVKSRLKERNLRWSEVNPGLLKVKIFSASRHSKNI